MSRLALRRLRGGPLGLDLALLKLERRLYRYAHLSPELPEMVDEGLGLAARARLRQVLSSAQHTQGHLQVVGVGEWSPQSTRPSCNYYPRLNEEEDTQPS